mmetsp:Transcript_26453/g.99494  ORF Transcript_26453/g.99494 Transcript_26453/m.99494 type:complete len:409 (+) Transcript_26453:1257-2483(+)
MNRSCEAEGEGRPLGPGRVGRASVARPWGARPRLAWEPVPLSEPWDAGERGGTPRPRPERGEGRRRPPLPVPAAMARPPPTARPRGLTASGSGGVRLLEETGGAAPAAAAGPAGEDPALPGKGRSPSLLALGGVARDPSPPEKISIDSNAISALEAWMGMRCCSIMRSLSAPLRPLWPRRSCTCRLRSCCRWAFRAALSISRCLARMPLRELRIALSDVDERVRVGASGRGPPDATGAGGGLVSGVPGLDRSTAALSEGVPGLRLPVELRGESITGTLARRDRLVPPVAIPGMPLALATAAGPAPRPRRSPDVWGAPGVAGLAVRAWPASAAATAAAAAAASSADMPVSEDRRTRLGRRRLDPPRAPAPPAGEPASPAGEAGPDTATVTLWTRRPRSAGAASARLTLT